MTAVAQKHPGGIVEAVKRLFFLKRDERPAPRPAPRPVSSPVRDFPYTLEQQQALEKLFEQLFKKKSVVTSGKLQLIGLEKIRQRLGERWPALRAQVYAIADEVIRANIEKGDIYVRYKEDTYVLIFALTGLEEGRARASRIASAIGKRLVETQEEHLKVIQVNPYAWETPTAQLEGKNFGDVISTVARTGEPPTIAMEAAAPPKVLVVQQKPELPALFYPLWDVRQKGLAAYLCALEKPEALSAVERDIETLRAAKSELQRMQKDGRNLTLVVPVRHGTLFNADSGNRYQMLYRNIPEAQRKCLVFVIVNFVEGLPQNSAFWFLPALKSACRAVFAEVPLRAKASLAGFSALGLDGVGVTADAQADEVASMGLLTAFSEQAKAAGLEQTFVLNVPTLSLVTSASCMGFQLIGGPAIHAPVKAPDPQNRFRYAELFANKGQGNS